MDLVEFLRARLEEDERTATAAHWGGRPDETSWSVYHGDQEWHERRMVVLDHEDNGVALVSDLATDEAGRVFGVAIAASESSDEDAIARHIARFDPHRITAEVDTKRRILAPYADALEQRELLRARMREVIYKDDDEFARLHRQESDVIETAYRLKPVVQALSLPYASHPDYDEAWRP